MAFGADDENATRFHDLDLILQEGLYQTGSIHHDEEIRRLKLQLLSLSDDNALLNDKISQKDAKQRALAKQIIFLGNELDETRGVTRAQETKLKKQTMEISGLKAEVESFGSAVQDSSKTLQEKFALERELDRLKPEIDHLRSQVSNHHTVLAEKHALQRQVDSLEVEIENEKRSKKIGLDKDNERAMDLLRGRIKAAENSLADERKQQDKMKKDLERELSEAVVNNEQLELRISALKAKLKSCQAELKEVKTELKSTEITSPGGNTKQSGGIKAQLSRKRHVDESNFGDITVQTPGNDQAGDKRQGKKKQANLMIEKSTFSITPFLNRTKLSIDDSVASEDQQTFVEQETREESSSLQSNQLTAPQETMAPPPKPVAKATGKPQKPRGRPKKVASGVAPSGGGSAPETGRLETVAGTSTIPINAKAPEQDDSQVTNNENGLAPHIDSKILPVQSQSLGKGVISAGNARATEGKKKRRKLLGAGNGTIMEENDGETDAPLPSTQKIALAGPRKRAPLGRAPLNGIANAFGTSTFSPLKREKRGVNASFLA